MEREGKVKYPRPALFRFWANKKTTVWFEKMRFLRQPGQCLGHMYLMVIFGESISFNFRLNNDAIVSLIR